MNNQRVPPPKIQQSDLLRVNRPERQVESRTEEAIWDTIRKMNGLGESAERNYQAALEALRRDPGEVVASVSRIYKRLSDHPSVERWALVQLLADLKRPESLPLLEAILSTRLPSQGEKATHRRGRPGASKLVKTTDVAAEVILCTTAIEAIERLAAQRNSHALEILLKNVRHPVFSVRRAAVQAYLARGGSGARDVLLKKLPERDHYILNIRRITAEQIPQPDPGVCKTFRDPNKLPSLRRIGEQEA